AVVLDNTGMVRVGIAVVLAALAATAPAQTLYRCKDASGKISFSDRACTGQATAPVQRRGKLEGDCAQGSKDACDELKQTTKKKPKAKTNAGKKKSQPDRQGQR